MKERGASVLVVAVLLLVIVMARMVVVGSGRVRVERMTLNDEVRNVLGGLGNAGGECKCQDRCKDAQQPKPYQAEGVSANERGHTASTRRTSRSFISLWAWRPVAWPRQMGDLRSGRPPVAV